MIDFRNVVRQNENTIRTQVSGADDVYTPNNLGDLINLSGDWQQRLKQSTSTMNINGNVELLSMNWDNALPMISMNSSEAITLSDGGNFGGKIGVSNFDLTQPDRDVQEKVLGDLEALYKQMYYKLDDIIYGNMDKYKNMGMYGLVTNPLVTNGDTSLAATYGNSTAEQIIADFQAFVRGYFDDINSDADVRPINVNALNVTVKIPTVVYKVLRQKKYESTDFKANYQTVLEYLQAWLPREGYNVTIMEDAGMDIVDPIMGGNGANVMMIGVFSTTYMSVEVPFAPHRFGMKRDSGFHKVENGETVAYVMRALGTQVARGNIFLTRDV